MKFVDEFRDREAVLRQARAITRLVTRPWTVMEICGGQTHAIVRYGLDQLLPPGVELVHGPGCPVCVTPAPLIDRAVAMAGLPGVIMTSFGDMARVPGECLDQQGHAASLLAARARGADVRLLYTPLEALRIARENPDRQVIFFAVGFETTAPATALAVRQAADEGIENFSLLVAHVLVPPAMEAILADPDNRVQGFLAAGHVCTVMGYAAYEPIAHRFGVPLVVTGFEPLDILQGLYLCLRQLEAGEARVENQYARSVTRQGNTAAQALLHEVFTVTTRPWRGLGEIPGASLALSAAYARFDAERRFGAQLQPPPAPVPGECRAGEVLRGLIKPAQCPAFGTRCTPENPLGAPMVSSEGACAAYFHHRAHPRQPEPAAR